MHSIERALITAAERLALQLPPRRAQQDECKKATISRAEGGQLQAPVGRRRRDADRAVIWPHVRQIQKITTNRQ